MRIVPSPEDLAELTAAWTGERFADGRPRVSDETLRKLSDATTEQAWDVLRQHGFHRQFAGGWRQTHPGRILVGRAVTAQFLPHRPDYDAAIVAAGAREGRMEGDRQNSWIIETLQTGDVMVCDIFGKVRDGTVIGDNLGSAIAARTGVGAVIDGGIRDMTGLSSLDNANFFFRDNDPTAIADVTLAGINLPIRLGEATVLPGDVVLGTPSGIMTIPAQLAETVANAADDIRVRDIFGKLRLADRTYTSAQIDVADWEPHIEADFESWLANRG
jgi:regulator of RNase E activity RraA